MCGACTILLDGDSVRACLMFAVQADGCRIETVEGLGRIGKLNPLQEAFHEHHALQCGFCTPGMLMTATDLLKKYPLATDDEIREGLSGNLCRCTGYEHIVAAIRAVKDTPMKMHVLSGGRLRMRKSVYVPDAERSETIDLPVSCFLLRHRAGQRAVRHRLPSVGRRGSGGALGRHGQDHDADHAAWRERAHRARWHRLLGRRHRCRGVLAPASRSLRLQRVLQARDRHGARERTSRPRASRMPRPMGYLAAEWDFGTIDAVDGERDLFGDGRIVLIPLPGHTPGTIGALVKLERCGTFLLAADAVPLRATLDQGIVPRNFANADAALKSLAEIRAHRGGRRHRAVRPRRRAMGHAAQGRRLL